ncbi:response regulator transcription factor [Candidatus Peregrinibacteria bacterium]|nr:response regulator transcription factor [Candidatus Peregrinibacteria bacterium]
MKILLIDDEKTIVEDLKKILHKMKWKVETAMSYEEGIKSILAHKYDVIICDHHFPCSRENEQGLDIIKMMRRNKINTPVIILTGCDITQIKPWDAFNIGVDDFIRKPYHPEEIIARVKAVARRSFPTKHNSTNIINHGDLSIDLDKKKLSIKGKEVYLSSTRYLILTKLLKNIGVFISYDDLIRYLWGEDALNDKKANNKLRVHISHLRKILGSKFGKCIKTVQGRGFLWEDEL